MVHPDTTRAQNSDIPNVVAPAVDQAIAVTKPIAGISNVKIERSSFWKVENDEVLSQLLEQLGLALQLINLDDKALNDLPPAYAVVYYVFYFEAECKFEGWLAIENAGAEKMKKIRYYYEKIGLAEEAKAIEKSEAAWYASGGHDGQGYDSAAEAYKSVKNPYADENERRKYMLNFMRHDEIWLPQQRQ